MSELLIVSTMSISAIYHSEISASVSAGMLMLLIVHDICDIVLPIIIRHCFFGLPIIRY